MSSMFAPSVVLDWLLTVPGLFVALILGIGFSFFGREGTHRRPRRQLSTIHEVPWYMRGNPYIQSGYRYGYTWAQTLRSTFQWHNESMNVWSHLGGFLLFTYFCAVELSQWWAEAGRQGDSATHDLLVLVYILGTQFLMLMSTCFHLLGCVSERVYSFTAVCDYVGITVLIVVSFLPMMHSLFYCAPLWALGYCIMILVVGAVAIFLSVTPYFQTPSRQWVRACVFLCMGGMGAFPVLHGLFAHAWDAMAEVLTGIGLMGFLYVTGALLYAFHVPERWFPGQVDRFLHSHMLFHLFIVAAAYVHLVTCKGVLEWRRTHFPTCEGW